MENTGRKHQNTFTENMGETLTIKQIILLGINTRNIR